ncbi:peptidase M50 [Prosthecochloris marina]|uniref:Peptidase M50 n=1 Tax=Prosthecochloris marina TaxID=2017681 RepID=A0A317T3W5_9CHLB|nr:MULTISPECIES: site-2 protease family protein [Prosthecochloris]PWW81294.1 peptidase M50 [Prosthecochloris marina]UZJ39453.1 site-2 protease family protein [Prosthecochloris sp. SCSIO W1102]
MFIAIFSFVLVLSVVVLVHEFGHFLAARKAGVPVYEFSVGFPFSPRVATLFRHRETEFTLRLLPLGGFVSFSSETDEHAKKLFAASRTSRALIMSAGSLFNVIFAFLLFVPAFMIGESMSLSNAVVASIQTIWSVISETIRLFINIFSGSTGVENLSGPVGITVLAGQAASGGWMDLLLFTGFLSLSLGIMNMIPFPGLDGGQLFILLIEALRNKPMCVRTHQIVNLAGIVLFIMLSLFVTWHDITKLIS